MTKLLLLALAFAASTGASTQAQTYPSRPITLVSPIAPGGAVDTAARIFAEKMQTTLQQPVTVENRTGAGAMIGTGYVAKAAPDGYTLLLIENSAVFAKFFHKSVPYDVTRDFTPIALLAKTTLVLLAHPSVPANDVKELIAYSRANPGKLSVGLPGIGTPHHLAAIMLGAAAKIDMTYVHYRGAAPALNDLLGGQIPLMWATPVAVLPFVEQGKVKALGVSAPQRLAILPQIPTVAEAAIPDFQIETWVGIAAPAKVPPTVVARLDQAIRNASDQPDVQKRMSALGYRLDFRSGDKFAELIAAEHDKHGKIIREAGIQPN